MAKNRNPGLMGSISRLFTGGAKREADFDAGGAGRRVRNWRASGGGPNTISLGSLKNIRDRSRDLSRKVPWITSAIESVAADIVGTGIRPRSSAVDDKFRKSVEILFRDWNMDADADGVQPFYGLQLMAVRTVIEAGECFVRRRPRRLADGLSAPLQIQILEPEFVPLDNAMGMIPRGGNVVKQGIEFNPLGQRVAYWMYKDHPYDYAGIGRIQNLEVVRVPASEVLHIYKPLRPGQVRGIPWLYPVMLRVRDLLEYEDAELVRKKTAAMFAAFVTRKAGELGPLEDDEEDTSAASDSVGETTLEAGTVQILEAGEDVTFSNPADSGSSYEPFLKTQLRAIASAVGATYEAVTGDYSDSNFSAARMARNTINRRTAPFQDLFSFQFNQPILNWLIEAAFIGGKISAAGYVDSPRDHTRAEWIAPGWPYTNPKEEAAADELVVKAGLDSRKAVARRRGKEVTDIDLDQADDNARADSLGLVHTSDGRYATKNPNQADSEPAATDSSGTTGKSKAGAK